MTVTYVAAFHGALQKLRSINGHGSDWWPRDQPESTALAWAIGLELSPRETKWVYSCWGSRPALKAAVLKAYLVRYCIPGERVLPGPDGRSKTFYPRQYLVDFSTYPKAGNKMLLAMESEAYADHNVGTSEIDPHHDYNWDFSKLLYLPAVTRVFVVRVRGADRRTQLWGDLSGMLAKADGAFTLDLPVIVYVLASDRRGENIVGVWDGSSFRNATLGTWAE